MRDKNSDFIRIGMARSQYFSDYQIKRLQLSERLNLFDLQNGQLAFSLFLGILEQTLWPNRISICSLHSTRNSHASLESLERQFDYTETMLKIEIHPLSLLLIALDKTGETDFVNSESPSGWATGSQAAWRRTRWVQFCISIIAQMSLQNQPLLSYNLLGNSYDKHTGFPPLQPSSQAQFCKAEFFAYLGPLRTQYRWV